MKLVDTFLIVVLALSLTLVTVEITNSVIRYAFNDKQDYPEKGK